MQGIGSTLSVCTCMHRVLFLSICPFLQAFDDEHCWEPYMPHGNFSSSDLTYQLGTTVTFTCSPGFVMEQGTGMIECVDPSNPHWNDSEPVCRGESQGFSRSYEMFLSDQSFCLPCPSMFSFLISLIYFFNFMPDVRESFDSLTPEEIYFETTLEI